MKMVTCKWFYRKTETELAKDEDRLSQVRAAGKAQARVPGAARTFPSF